MVENVGDNKMFGGLRLWDALIASEAGTTSCCVSRSRPRSSAGKTNLVRAASAVVPPRPEPVSLRPALAAVEAGPVVDPPSRGSDHPWVWVVWEGRAWEWGRGWCRPASATSSPSWPSERCAGGRQRWVGRISSTLREPTKSCAGWPWTNHPHSQMTMLIEIAVRQSWSIWTRIQWLSKSIEFTKEAVAKVLSEQTNMALPDIELLKNLTNDKDQNCVQNLKNKVKSSKSKTKSSGPSNQVVLEKGWSKF